MSRKRHRLNLVQESSRYSVDGSKAVSACFMQTLISAQDDITCQTDMAQRCIKGAQSDLLLALHVTTQGRHESAYFEVTVDLSSAYWRPDSLVDASSADRRLGRQPTVAFIVLYSDSSCRILDSVDVRVQRLGTRQEITTNSLMLWPADSKRTDVMHILNPFRVSHITQSFE